MNNLNKKIILGKFGKVYGVKGWIRLFSYTENKKSIFLYKKLFIINDINNVFFINFNKYKNKKKYFIVQINNVFKNKDSNKFVNHHIYIFKNELIKYKKKKEYYWNDIIGCYILNNNKIYLGRVTNIVTTKLYDILIIQSNNLYIKKKIFIPFIEPNIIRDVDLINNIIKVNWSL
ncbi:16S rRNA processing protein RimM [Enterobacteriaceae endosymbiont of Donacia bicoloricornis]|uniref:ribosome maturation factor RimM n=1 Tax=Enterobacteriaceae endosymbiont of Donacia bicoloricornis TaxID=2675772 RepID=UPI001448ECF9|nr:ribosome maturation factor RimM [Enterobacteriaceae endosymbiont of Donacia bicoloricornis]QJC37904.1 16S rRNA processing protein RimM [Enterobacteriaceae endosymbiont of Donacia bicoloricornis]